MRLEIWAGTLAAVILLFQLLAPPIVGLADNGDFWRMMPWGGLHYLSDQYDQRYFSYINRIYILKPFTQTGDYVSSEVLFVKIAVFLNQWFTEKGFFDIRTLGVVHAIFFLSAFLFNLRSAKRIRVFSLFTSAGLFLFFFCDVAYIAYFNSLYTEPASLIFLFFTIGFGARMIFNEKPPFRDLLAFSISGILFVGAKPQNSVLGLFLAMFILRLSSAWPPLSWKRLSMFLVLPISVFSIWYYSTIPGVITREVLYNSVFWEILRKSDRPEEDLNSLGLGREFINLKGTHAYLPDSPVHDKAFGDRFFPHVSFFTILKFYLTHPDRFLPLIEHGASNAFTMRPDYLGNFEKSSGFPYRFQSQAFTFWSDLKKEVFPGKIWFLGSLSFLIFFAITIGWIRARTIQQKLMIEGYLLLIFMAITQFFVTVIGGGEADVPKHLFLFHVIFDLSCIVALILILEVGRRVMAMHKRHFRTDEFKIIKGFDRVF